jgi:hypothetical protein
MITRHWQLRVGHGGKIVRKEEMFTIMNAKDEQVSRSYINLLSRWQ